MRINIEKQLAPITISQIKETLKIIAPESFDKMIIRDNDVIRRCNYIYVKLRYQKAERVVEKIKFPLYQSLLDKFNEIEGGSVKHGEKAKLSSGNIIETLNRNYAKNGLPIIDTQMKDPFDFPFETENGEISSNQPIYYFPDLSFHETCDQCHGHLYVNCSNDDCSGRHKWQCPSCGGNGVISCKKCGGKKFIDCPNCSGTTQVKCKHCGGDGKLNDGLLARTIFLPFVSEKTCRHCAGKGVTYCKSCTAGKISCTHCHGIGKEICPECASQGTVTCFDCYGDQERNGKVNCPQCQTEGKTGQVVYVQTKITTQESSTFIPEGPVLNISEKQLKNHISEEQPTELVYKKINNEIIENYNEHSRNFAKNMERDLGLYKGEFPMILKEEMHYQLIACLEFSYKHMLTNTRHQVTIIDFWNNPEIIHHSEPEILKGNFKNSKKSLNRFFGRIFSTNKYKTIRDARNEIILLIHLVKVDGLMDDREKVQLSEMISSFDRFTNTEKQNLFNLLNSKQLPEIKKSSVQFSSKEKAELVLAKMSELASADGEASLAETELIQKVRSLMET